MTDSSPLSVNKHLWRMKTHNPPLPPFRKGGVGGFETAYWNLVIGVCLKLVICLFLPTGRQGNLISCETDTGHSTKKTMATKGSVNIYPLYFLFGPEDFLIEEETKRLLDQTLSPSARGFNLHIFSGEDHTSQEIVQSCTDSSYVLEISIYFGE